MRDFSGHHYRKAQGHRERFGPYSDPTAREAIRNVAERSQKDSAVRDAFADLCRACRGGYDEEIVRAAMRLYGLAKGD